MKSWNEIRYGLHEDMTIRKGKLVWIIFFSYLLGVAMMLLKDIYLYTLSLG